MPLQTRDALASGVQSCTNTSHHAEQISKGLQEDKRALHDKVAELGGLLRQTQASMLLLSDDIKVLQTRIANEPAATSSVSQCPCHCQHNASLRGACCLLYASSPASALHDTCKRKP